MNSITNIIFLLILSTSTFAEQIIHNIEILFFKQKPDMDKFYSRTPKIYRLPNLDPEQTNLFLTKDYYSDSFLLTNKNSKVHLYLKWLEKSEYTIINYSNNQFTIDDNIKVPTNLFFTNQASIIEAVQEEYFEPLRYVSRGYIDNLSINPFLMSVELKKTNDESIFLSIYTTYITSNQEDFLIREQRKVNLEEINYFDNNEYGLFITISEYEATDNILDPNDVDEELSNTNNVLNQDNQ